MKEDHDDLLETPVKESKQRERDARAKAKSKPKRERRIKPIQTTVAPLKTETSDPVESGLPYRGPFQADGVQVKDKDGRIVCMVASQAPMDVRIATAAKLCDTLNASKEW